MNNDVPVVRDLPEDLHTPAPELTPVSERPTWRGYRRKDGRVGTRNFLLIVPTSMCASHEAQQIATLAEFTIYSREKFPNVDGVVAIPHNKGCGCSDGSNIDVMLRTLSNYATHPNVGGVIFIGLGCEKTNLTAVEKYLQQEHIDLGRPSSASASRKSAARKPSSTAAWWKWRRCCPSSTTSRAPRPACTSCRSA